MSREEEIDACLQAFAAQNAIQSDLLIKLVGLVQALERRVLTLENKPAQHVPAPRYK